MQRKISEFLTLLVLLSVQSPDSQELQLFSVKVTKVVWVVLKLTHWESCVWLNVYLSLCFHSDQNRVCSLLFLYYVPGCDLEHVTVSSAHDWLYTHNTTQHNTKTGFKLFSLLITDKTWRPCCCYCRKSECEDEQRDRADVFTSLVCFSDVQDNFESVATFC